MLFAHPAFALLWCARVLSNIAFNMLGVAVGWQLYELTGSALDLGLVGLAQFAPIVLLTLIVGQVADRYDRRLSASIGQFVQAAAAAALVAGTASGRLSSAGIFLTVALVGAARAFEGPTSTALVSDVVPRPLISRAMAWLMSATQTARIVGPALGGFLYVIGPGTTYATAGALFLGAGTCAAIIRVRRASRLSEPVVLDTVLSGLVFIRNQRVLLGTMSLDMFAVLLGGGATALLPIYAGATSWARARRASGSCARPPRSGRSRRRSSLPTGHCSGESGAHCFARSSSSAWRPSPSASRPASSCRSPRSPCSARPTS